jgi:pimeloyl-ACP methyl ester carboxylesterase
MIARWQLAVRADDRGRSARPPYWEKAAKDSNEELVATLAQGLAPGTDRHVELDMRVDLAPLLSQIVAPTLLIESTWDEIVPASQQQALQAANRARRRCLHRIPRRHQDQSGWR